MRSKMFTFLAVSVLLMFGSGAAPAMAEEIIEYHGSSTVGQYISEASQVYQKAAFAIDTSTESAGGENIIAAGKGDLGGVARELRPKIIKKGVKKYLIGYDAIGVWVHESNPVGSMSRDQLRGIFSGRITNWKEVGGNDSPINVYIVNFKSATRKVFGEIVMGGDRYSAKNLKTIIPDNEILDAVANDKNGIGHLSMAFSSSQMTVKAVKVDGQAPDKDNASYAVRRPLYLITGNSPKAHVKAFIDWSLSQEGQAVVRKHFIGIK